MVRIQLLRPIQGVIMKKIMKKTNRVVKMIDRKTGERVFYSTSKEESDFIFDNRDDISQYVITSTMPQYFFDHLVATGEL